MRARALATAAAPPSSPPPTAGRASGARARVRAACARAHPVRVGTPWMVPAAVDTLFIAVNAATKKAERERIKASGGAAPPGGRDDEKSLNPVEFLICLVQVAIMRYVLTKQVRPISHDLARSRVISHGLA